MKMQVRQCFARAKPFQLKENEKEAVFFYV